MEFTEGFKTVGARLSPSGRYVAGLYRRDTAQLFVAVHFTTNGALHYLLTVPESSPGRRELVWAPNNQFLLLVDYVLAKLFVWDFEASGQPICSITENVRLGVERIMWAPDSHHVLVVLKHRVAARIWKLDEKFPRAVIHSPKFTDRGFTFSPDGRWLAVLVRREFEDVIIVYDSAWRVVQSVRPPESANLEDLVFCPFLERTTELRSAIIAWEAPAFSDRIFIFAPDGASCKVISGLAEYSSGYEKVVWSKAGWIAAAVRDPTSFSLWNSITQKMGAILDIVFKEKVVKEVNQLGNVVERSKCTGVTLSYYLVDESGFQLQVGRSVDTKKIPNLQIEFSNDSAYIAAVTSEYPNCVWIINVSELAVVAVLQQASPVRSFSWHDVSPILVVATDASNIFVWQPSGCLSIPQPAVNDPRLVRWAPGNDTLLIAGSTSFCLAVPDWATY